MNNRTLRLWFALSLTLAAWPPADCTLLRAAENDQKGQIDQLIKTLGNKDHRTRYQAASALVRIGVPAIKPLIAALGSEDAAMRAGAAMALGSAAGNAKLRPSLADAIGPLIQLLGDKDNSVRGYGARALGRIGEPAIKPLIAALGDKDPRVRAGAAMGLGSVAGDAKLRPSLEAAIGPLIGLLGDKDDSVRRYGSTALGAIGEPAVKPLIAALGSKDPQTRAEAAGVIAQICESTWYSRQKISILGPALKEAIGPLNDLTKDVSSKVRSSAYRALAYVDDKRREEILTAALQDVDAVVRCHACIAAGRLRRRTVWTPKGSQPIWPGETVDKKLIDALIACLKRSGEERQFAARALGIMGDRRAVEPLTAAAKQGNERSRAAAIEAMGRLGGPKALAALKSLLRDQDWIVRLYTARALGETQDPEALEAMLPMLTDTKQEVRGAATASLYKMARTPRGSKAILGRIKQIREAFRKQLGQASRDTVFMSGTESFMRGVPKLDFADTELKDVFQFLRNLTGANFSVDWGALAKVDVTRSTKISVHLTNVSLERALGSIIQNADKGKQRIGCVFAGRYIIVSTREKLPLIAGDMVEDIAFMAGADRNMRERLARRITLDFKDTALKDVFRFLREISDLNLVIEWGALAKADVTKSTKMSVQLREVSLDHALGQIIRDVDKGKGRIGRMAADGCIVVAPRARLALIAKDTSLVARGDPAMQKQLAMRVPKLQFDDVDLKDVLQFLREISGINLFVDWGALAKVNVTKSTKVSLNVTNIALGRVLGLIVQDVDGGKQLVGHAAVGGCIMISTRAELAKLSSLPTMPPKPSGEADLAVWKTLAAKVPKLDFSAIHLSDVMQFLRVYTKVQIEVDWPALEKLGVKKTTPVTVNLSKVSLAAALQFVLNDAGGMGKLGYSIKDGKIVISKAKPLKAPAAPTTGSHRPSATQPAATTRPVGKATEAEEREAAARLRLAEAYLGAGKKQKAAEIYKEIIQQWPNTGAAKAAKARLAALPGD